MALLLTDCTLVGLVAVPEFDVLVWTSNQIAFKLLVVTGKISKSDGDVQVRWKLLFQFKQPGQVLWRARTKAMYLPKDVVD